MTDIVYICNKRKDCANSLRCGKECTHTTDPKFAFYGACKYPWMYPDRFKPDLGPNGICFIEQARKKVEG